MPKPYKQRWGLERRFRQDRIATHRAKVKMLSAMLQEYEGTDSDYARQQIRYLKQRIRTLEQMIRYMDV